MADDFRIKIDSDLDLSKAESKINSFLSKYNGKEKIKLGVEIDSKNISKLEKEINSLKKSINSTSNSKINVGSGLSKTTNAAKKDFQILKNLANEISKKKITLAGLDTSKNENQIKELSSQLRKLESDYKVLSKTLGSNLNASQIGELESIFGKAADKVNLLTAKAKDLEKATADLSKPFNKLDAEIAANKTETFLKNNTKLSKELKNALESVATAQRNASSHVELKDYNRQFNEIKTRAASLGQTGKSFRDEFARAFGQIFEFAGVYNVIQEGIFEGGRQMIQSVRDINSAQIELMKVSDAPTSQLNAYWDEAAESAKKYGATINEVINSTADWSRLGYNLEDAKKLSDATTLMQKIGDNMTQESSAEGIISTLRGFKLEADEVTKIIDSVNEVANTQPIDTSGIFEGLKRSASSMSAANNTLEETIALITAANSVVQDPVSVGTAFKTVSMRIRGATTELEQAGLDTEGMASSTAKLREELLALSGVDIMIDDSTFKSTYKILEELSEKWSSLSDIQQASITELIAGKRQGNLVSALMTNFDIAKETLNTAMNESTGSAERELENYQKGIESSIEKFKATFQELSTSLISSDIFKGSVDGATALLSVLEKLVSVMGGLPALFAGIAGYKIFTNFGNSIEFALYGCESIVA